MSAIKGEKRTTWDYVCQYVRPAMRNLGIPFTIIPSHKYATKGFWGGEERRSPLLPMFTNQSGQAGKLNEWCSGEWKREVAMRWANEQAGWKQRGVDNWIGISWDERDRRRSPRRLWLVPVYPLLDFLPKPLHISACLQAVEQVGWPEPPRSRCVWCPNQSDAEWAELSPQELEKAAMLEDHIHTIDPNAFMHKSMIPLRQVVLDQKDNNDGMFGGGCKAGMCF